MAKRVATGQGQRFVGQTLAPWWVSRSGIRASRRELTSPAETLTSTTSHRLGEGERAPKGLWAEEEAVAPSPHQGGEVGVGFSQRWGLGLLESVKKLVMLLGRGKVTGHRRPAQPPRGAAGQEAEWLALNLSGAIWSPSELLVPNCYDFWGHAGEEKQDVFGCELKPNIGTTTYRASLYFLGDLFDNLWQVQTLDPNKTLPSSNPSLRLNNWQRTNLVKEGEECA